MIKEPIITPTPPKEWDTLDKSAKSAFLAAITEVKTSKICPKNSIQRIFRRAAQVGLFATHDMPAGTFIGEYVGRTLQSKNDCPNPNYIFYPNGIEVDKGRYGPESKARYSSEGIGTANHSRHAFNMAHEPGSYEFYLTKDVKAGEELTWHYGDYDF